jgi:hypothetical protein
MAETKRLVGKGDPVAAYGLQKREFLWENRMLERNKV